MIEIDRESLEFDYSNITPISINRELYLRLLKTAVYKVDSKRGQTYESIEASSEMLWPLTHSQSG